MTAGGVMDSRGPSRDIVISVMTCPELKPLKPGQDVSTINEYSGSNHGGSG